MIFEAVRRLTIWGKHLRGRGRQQYGHHDRMVRRNSGSSPLLYKRVAFPMRSKNARHGLGIESAFTNVSMPILSASSSWDRVKLI